MNKIQGAFEAIKADDKLKNAAMESVRTRIKAESEKREKKNPFFGKRLAYGAAFCCALILAVGIFGFYSVYTSPVSYVSIDINPSIELVLNRFNVVIETNAYNDDGLKITEAVDVSNMNYEDAIDKLLGSEQFSSYVEDDYELVFTVISDNQEEIINGIENTQCYQKYGSACVGADYETRQEAMGYGMSFGKYKAYLQLIEYYPGITPEECNKLSMNEIKDLITQKGGDWNLNSQSEECTGTLNENKGQKEENRSKENGKGTGNGEGEQHRGENKNNSSV